MLLRCWDQGHVCGRAVHQLLRGVRVPVLVILIVALLLPALLLLNLLKVKPVEILDGDTHTMTVEPEVRYLPSTAYHVQAKDPITTELRHVSKSVQSRLKCKPRRNIFFLRVYKTGSSTIATMLYRYVDRHNLTLLTTVEDVYPSSDIRASLFRQPGKAPLQYNVFTEHTVFDAKSAAALMPNDTFYLASVRHPLAQLRSMFNEKNYTGKLRLARDSDPVREFLVHKRDKAAELQNHMSTMFGLKAKDFGSEEAIREMITRANSSFDLVAVNEFFDESMVLLRRRMCWNMDDVIYLTQRKKGYSYKNDVSDVATQDAMRDWSHADFELHDYFSRHLLPQIRLETDFWDELAIYRTINNNMAAFCQPFLEKLRGSQKTEVYRIVNYTDRITFDPKPWGDPFSIEPFDCAVMKMGGVLRRNVFKIKQNPDICKSKYIKRDFTSGSVHMYIKWKDNSTVILHRAYCEDIEPRYGIPLKALTQPVAFMWP